MNPAEKLPGGSPNEGDRSLDDTARTEQDVLKTPPHESPAVVLTDFVHDAAPPAPASVETAPSAPDASREASPAAPDYSALITRASVQAQLDRLVAERASLQSRYEASSGDERAHFSEELSHCEERIAFYDQAVKTINGNQKRTADVRGLVEEIDRAISGDRPQKQAALSHATEIFSDPRYASAVLQHKGEGVEGVKNELLIPEMLEEAGKRAEDLLRSVGADGVNGIPEKLRQRLESEALRDLIAYLNRIRQVQQEVSTVYRFVMGRDESGVGEKPSFLIQRPDLYSRFDFGKDKNYRGELGAAHDLIEFLVAEAEKRLKDLLDEAVKKTTLPDSGAASKVEPEPRSDPKGKKPDDVPPVKPDDVPPPPKPTPKPIHPKPDTPEEPPKAEIAPLATARQNYLKALKLRGNVFRGKALGRLLGRTMEVDGAKVTLGGADGLRILETLGDRYEASLAAERESRIKSFIAQHVQVAEAAGKPVTEAELIVLVNEESLRLLAEEETLLDAETSSGIERTRLEKLKNVWRQHGKTRMVIGLALMGLSLPTFGLAGSAYFVGGRALWGAAGSYTGIEASLERHRVLGIKSWNVGHRGLIDDLSKEVSATKDGDRTEALAKRVAELPEGELHKELARLRQLSVDKSVTLENAGRDGAKTSDVIRALLSRRQELMRNRIAKELSGVGESAAAADIMLRQLQAETSSYDTGIEKAEDTERVNKIIRKSTAAATAALTGAFILRGLQGKPTVEPLDQSVAPPEPGIGFTEAPLDPSEMEVTPPSMPDVDVSNAKSVWDVVELKANAFGESPLGNAVNMPQVVGSEGRFAYVIDAIKDTVRENPNEFGLPSNIDIVSAQDLEALAQNKAFNELLIKSLVDADGSASALVERAAGLSEAAVSNIEAHNAFYEVALAHSDGVVADQAWYDLMDKAYNLHLTPEEARTLVSQAHALGMDFDKATDVIADASATSPDAAALLASLDASAAVEAGTAHAAAEAGVSTAEAAANALQEKMHTNLAYTYSNKVVDWMVSHGITVDPVKNAIIQNVGENNNVVQEILIAEGLKPDSIEFSINSGTNALEVSARAAGQVQHFYLTAQGDVMGGFEGLTSEAAAAREASSRATHAVLELSGAAGKRMMSEWSQFKHAFEGVVNAGAGVKAGELLKSLGNISAETAAGKEVYLVAELERLPNVTHEAAKDLAEPLHDVFRILRRSGVELKNATIGDMVKKMPQYVAWKM